MKIRVFIALLILAGFLGVSALRSFGFFIHDIYRVQEFLGGDKATHFLMGAAFMMAGLLLFWQAAVCRIVLVFMLAASLVCAEECAQFFIESREFNSVDLGMGLIGVSTVFVLTIVFNTLKAR